jgi:hypothetical protein
MDYHYQWKRFKESSCPDPVKNMMLLTMDFGFYPIIDDNNDYVLINKTDHLMIEWSGWYTIYWSLYDTTKANPKSIHYGMKYIPLLESFGTPIHESVILTQYLTGHKNGKKSTS